MGPMRGRWLDLGTCSPVTLHAAYSGVAEAMADDDPPVLVWARGQAHVSIGASQWAGAELDLSACRARDIPVIARPLGGGTVWLDEHQPCFFLIAPRQRLGGRHPPLFARGLEAAAAVYHHFGLPVEQVGESDLWLAGRKILGSGAATINRAMVFGSSFLLDFDAAAFSRVVACPSPRFRSWLSEALAEGMTSWQAHAPNADAIPTEAALQAALRRAFGAAFDCDFAPSDLYGAEVASIEAAREDCEDVSLHAGEVEATRQHRLVRNGIKVNHHTYLVETDEDGQCLRLWLRAGRIHRIASGQESVTAILQNWRGCEAQQPRLLSALDGEHGVDKVLPAWPEAEYWAARIDAAAADVRRVWHG